MIIQAKVHHKFTHILRAVVVALIKIGTEKHTKVMGWCVPQF